MLIIIYIHETPPYGNDDDDDNNNDNDLISRFTHLRVFDEFHKPTISACADDLVGAQEYVQTLCLKNFLAILD